MKNRFLSLLLALTMVFLFVPAGMFAEEGDNTSTEEVSTEAPEPIIEEIEEVPEEEETQGPPPAEEEIPAEEPEIKATPAEEEPAADNVSEVEEEPAAEEVKENEPATEEDPVTGEGSDQAGEAAAEGPASEEEKPAAEAENEQEEAPVFVTEEDTLIKYNGEDEEVTVPDGIRVIAARAFAENEKVKKVTLPDSVEIIKEFAFEGCSNLEAVIIGEQSGLKAIEKGAFQNAKKLDASFAENVQAVDEAAFEVKAEAEQPEEADTTAEKNKEETAEEQDSEEKPAQEESEEELIIEQPVIVETESDEPIVEDIVIQETVVEEPEEITVEEQTEEEPAAAGASDEEPAEDETDGEELDIIEIPVLGLLEGDNAPVITEQTEAINAKIGDSITLHVAATGTAPLTYQWQFALKGSNSFRNASSAEAKNADWTMSMIAGLVGRQYQCVVTDANGKTATSQPILISEITGPVITEQTEAISAAIGDSITLHVAATGTAPLTYQWQFAVAGSSSFRNASSADAKNADWTMNMVAGLIGRQYQCIVTDANGQTTTSQPILISEATGSDAPVITEQTETISAAIGDSITLHVAATGTAPLTYQWQFAVAGSSSFRNASSADAKNADWTMNMVAGLVGRQYQCVVTDANGKTATSQPILISEATASDAPVITEQTEAISAAIGESITLHVAATGTAPLTYQWQFAVAGSSSFRNASSADAKKADWTMNMVAGLIGRQYQCVVTDANGKTATTQPILISEETGSEAPVITEQTEAISAAIGENFTLHVAATGAAPLTYQWQFALAGSSSFKNASSADAKKADWTISMVAGLIGRQYQCVVTDANGKTATTQPILISEETGSEAPVITEQTEAISAAIGENFTLHVAATGTAPLTYQWQFALAGSSSFKNASSTDAKKADWTISMVAGLIGRQYQCVVTDANGETATSQPILISESIETEPPVITEQTEAISAVIGESFTLHVAATGTEPLTYQWQFAAAGSTSFKNASSVEAKNSDWTISMVKGLIGRQYQCVVTDANGKTATSQPILISENIETEPPVITEQTETIKAKIGESFTLHVAATGTEPLTYQWQFALAGTTEFRNASSVDAKNADWTITLVAGLIGRQYQCVVTDANGKTTTSAPILIEEDTAIIIDGVEYAIIDSQNCYVVSYSGTADSLTIPTTVEGHTVTEIGEEAFMGKSIVSISLPNTITIIHARAFKDCTNLSTMTNHD